MCLEVCFSGDSGIARAAACASQCMRWHPESAQRKAPMTRPPVFGANEPPSRKKPPATAGRPIHAHRWPAAADGVNENVLAAATPGWQFVVMVGLVAVLTSLATTWWNDSIDRRPQQADGLPSAQVGAADAGAAQPRTAHQGGASGRRHSDPSR